MNSSQNNRFTGTLTYIYAHWPIYLFVYSGLIVTLIFIGVTAPTGQLSLILVAFLLFLLLAYFLLASVWSAFQQYDRGGIRPHYVLFEMGKLKPSDTFVYIDLGLRRRPIGLSRYLTTGHIIVVDIYNPQWTGQQALIRWRKRMRPPAADPRLIWHSGHLDLLPLPDHSATTVILCQILSELWQHGDRLTLLQEIHRILTPDGRLLMAEQIRSPTNWLTLGPATLNLPTKNYWRTLLTDAGFTIHQEKNLRGILHSFIAAKQTATELRQLSLNLDLGQ